ncbi:MAG: hypothetical protein JWR49_2209 [Tardiphaga sp.]|nr:hypothetical protein [Tardiphaga sp.]
MALQQPRAGTNAGSIIRVAARNVLDYCYWSCRILGSGYTNCCEFDQLESNQPRESISKKPSPSPAPDGIQDR